MSTLRIGNLSWKFIGDKDFIKKLTTVMRLKDGLSSFRIVLSRGKVENLINKHPVSQGWEIHGKYATHKIIKDILYCIGEKQNDEQDFQLMKQSFFFPIFKEIIQAGGLIIHSTLLEKNKSGVILAGQNSSGKSKCARKAVKPWKSLSDDVTIFLNGKAYPFPTWSYFLHKKDQRIQDSWNVQKGIPIKAIFFLEKTNIDSVLHIEKNQAYSRLMEFSIELIRCNFQYLQKEELRKLRTQIFNNCMNTIKIYPTYVLRHSLNGNFIEKIEEVI